MEGPKFAPRSTPSRGPISKSQYLPHSWTRPTYDAKRHPDPIRRFATMHWTDRPTDRPTDARRYRPTDRPRKSLTTIGRCATRATRANNKALTVTLIQPMSMWTHWATRRCHSCLLTAAVSASSQLCSILRRSFWTTPVQFVLGRPGPFLKPGASQWCLLWYALLVYRCLMTEPPYSLLSLSVFFMLCCVVLTLTSSFVTLSSQDWRHIIGIYFFVICGGQHPVVIIDSYRRISISMLRLILLFLQIFFHVAAFPMRPFYNFHSMKCSCQGIKSRWPIRDQILPSGHLIFHSKHWCCQWI